MRTLAKSVRTALADLGAGGSDLEVTSDGEIVVISGRTTSYPQRYSMELAAKRTHGVRAVVSRLQTPFDSPVSSAAISDRQIARSALERLDRSRCANGLHLFVHQDRLVVAGEVAGQFERSTLVESLRTTPGIGAFEDHLIIRRPSTV